MIGGITQHVSWWRIPQFWTIVAYGGHPHYKVVVKNIFHLQVGISLIWYPTNGIFHHFNLIPLHGGHLHLLYTISSDSVEAQYKTLRRAIAWTTERRASERKDVHFFTLKIHF